MPTILNLNTPLNYSTPHPPIKTNETRYEPLRLKNVGLNRTEDLENHYTPYFFSFIKVGL